MSMNIMGSSLMTKSNWLKRGFALANLTQEIIEQPEARAAPYVFLDQFRTGLSLTAQDNR
jgi:hypothetical protein